jgi:hypothetical protein
MLSSPNNLKIGGIHFGLDLNFCALNVTMRLSKDKQYIVNID